MCILYHTEKKGDFFLTSSFAINETPFWGRRMLEGWPLRQRGKGLGAVTLRAGRRWRGHERWSFILFSLTLPLALLCKKRNFMTGRDLYTYVGIVRCGLA